MKHLDGNDIQVTGNFLTLWYCSIQFLTSIVPSLSLVLYSSKQLGGNGTLLGFRR